MADYEEEEKIKHLLEVLKRIDSYILSTNQKSAIVISYCAAVVGWLSINLNKILSEIELPLLFGVGMVSAIILILSSCYCIWLAVAVVLPVTGSSAVRRNGDSAIYFGDVASTKWGGSGYVTKLKQLKQTEFVDDLAQQVFSVSTIADAKFSKIQEMTKVLRLGGILSLGVFLLVLLINSLMTWMAK